MGAFTLVGVLGLITAAVASRRGRSPLWWGLFGALLFVVALPVLLLSKPNEEALVRRGTARKCPHCAEVVRPDARVCRFCGRDL